MCVVCLGDEEGSFSPSLGPLPNLIQSTTALEWGTISGSAYLNHRIAVVGWEVLGQEATVLSRLNTRYPQWLLGKNDEKLGLRVVKIGKPNPPMKSCSTYNF